MAEPVLSYCAAELRRHDHDRYLTCLFAPAERREALFALYAFNLEVARTAESVSEAMLGQIRLQWWRESLEQIYAGTPRQHAVVEPLAAAVRAHGLSRAPFEDLIDAREADLDPEPPADMAALEGYAEATAGSLVLLALELLGGFEGGADRGAVEAAGRELGLAWALTGLLRAVPFHARQKRLYLPRDLSEAAGLDLRDLFELRSSEALAAVVRQVASRAGEHLARARAGRQGVPRAARAALLCGVLAGCYLATLEKVGYDPFRPEVQAGHGAAAWRLALAAALGRY